MKKTFFLSFALTLGLVFTAQAQDDLTKPIPADPSVKTGVLSNGLTYFIKKNGKPEKRCELRLAINAGSMLETDEQQGLAHFVEHMCFNGTKNFKKSALVDFLESAGVKFGAHLNAYTSFDETVYMLQLPTDKDDIFSKGFQVLEDWAHNVTFDADEIEKERGVVISERRGRLGAQERMRQQYWPIIFEGSRYADRLPIGQLKVLESFKRETLIDVGRYNFNWQTLYKLKNPVAIPKGSRIQVSAVFDNSANNKLNPDTTKVVRFGEPTYDEMLVGFVDYARPKPVVKTAVKVAPAVLAKYIGDYSMGMGPTFTIKVEDGILSFSIPGQGAMVATPKSETEFFFKDLEDAAVSFVMDDKGEVTGLNAEFSGQKLKAKRVVKAASIDSK